MVTAIITGSGHYDAKPEGSGHLGAVAASLASKTAVQLSGPAS